MQSESQVRSTGLRRVWQLKRQNLNTKSFGFCHVPTVKKSKGASRRPIRAGRDKEPEMLKETERAKERMRDEEGDGQVKVFCLR